MKFDIRSLKILPEDIGFENIRIFKGHDEYKDNPLSMEEREIGLGVDLLTTSRFKRSNSPSSIRDHRAYFPISINKKLISSAEGVIKTIIFHYPEKNLPKDEKDIKFHQVILSLARSMSHVNFIIITEEKINLANQRVNLSKLFKKLTTNVCVYPIVSSGKDNFSIWASDAYKATMTFEEEKLKKCELAAPYTTNTKNFSQANHIPLAIQRRQNSSPNDKSQCKHVLKDLACKKYKEIKKFAFDGGNILVGDTFILIGNDYRIHAEELSNISRKNIEKHKKKVAASIIRQHLDSTKEIIFIGSSPTPKKSQVSQYTNSGITVKNTLISIDGINQSIFHLDLFLTLAGVCDKGNYQIAIPQPKVGLSYEEKKYLDSRSLSFGQQEVERVKRNLKKTLESLARKIYTDKNGVKKGFSLVRVPLILTYKDTIYENHINREWFWLSYHNAIVESTPNRKKVWLPSYNYNYQNTPLEDAILSNWETLSKKHSIKTPIKFGNWSQFLQNQEFDIEKIWRNQLGFDEVYFIRAHLLHFAARNGSLACMINCIERI